MKTAPDNAAIRLRAATFGYTPGRAAVRDFTAALEPGRVTAVIGPNAAGKTTLVKLMLGQLRPQSGEVTLGGRAVSAMSEPARARRIAYVPQRGGAAFAFTVRQVVAMGRFAHGDRHGIDEAIAWCDLDGVADRAFVELSGGQQQRVVLARAMAQLAGVADGVLLADEPASAMDLRHQLRAMRLLRELATARGAAVLMVMHDLNLAARFADGLWLLHEGALAAAGAAGDVLTPAVLEPVYGVSVRVVGASRDGRPVLVTEEAATLSGGVAP